MLFLEKWFEKLAPYIKHLHINDNDGISDLHRPVGKGKLDWNKFKEQIRQNSIESSILVEISSCKAAQEKNNMHRGLTRKKYIIFKVRTNWIIKKRSGF